MSKEILRKSFEELRLDLIKEYDAKGMRASGKWADSLQIETTDWSAKITGLNYSQQLETGRRAGKFPPISDIEKWIQDKGIQPNGITIKSLAFLIARKISRQGWNREGYGGVDLISTVATDERLLGIVDLVGQRELAVLRTDIIKRLK